MRNFKLFIFVTILISLMFSVSAFTEDLTDNYYKNLAHYFKISYEDNFEALLKIKVPNYPEDMAVILFMSQITKNSAVKYAELRAQGDDWQGIFEKRIVNLDIFYILVSGKINSKTYSPIFDKFNSLPSKDWNKIQLTDDDIINLANLKFLTSHLDYSIYKIMEMRDNGKSFVEIFGMVKQEKDIIISKMKEKEKLRALETDGE